MMTDLRNNAVDVIKEKRIKLVGKTQYRETWQVDGKTVIIQMEKGRRIITCSCTNHSRYTNKESVGVALCYHKNAVLVYSILKPILDKLKSSAEEFNFIPTFKQENSIFANELEEIARLRWIKEKKIDFLPELPDEEIIETKPMENIFGGEPDEGFDDGRKVYLGDGVWGYKKPCPEWLKKQYREEANYTCQGCGKHEDEVGTLTPHRIKRDWEGGLYTDCSLKHPKNNVKPSCKKCHGIYHSNEYGNVQSN